MSYTDLVEVIAHVTLDDSEAQTIQKAVDSQVKDWREQRRVIVGQIQDIHQGIGLLVRTIRMVAEATGTTLDPMQNALLGIVASTAGIITSTAIALTAGSLGILVGVGLGLAAFAYGFEIAQTIKIMADFIELRRANGEIIGRLEAIEGAAQYRGFMGGNI